MVISNNTLKKATTCGARPFTFVSTFKWEKRKGWDLLLQAYLAVSVLRERE